QFFINVGDNPYLDWFSPGPSKHPVFGKIVDGMDVVDKISKAPRDSSDRPKTPIKMIKVTVNET
ncbi:MAG TPA: peptidylprolyl isomerase, partial [Polyangia bacterium]|nr:peptidylprolyl isomerase [Polyangia bacterium]